MSLIRLCYGMAAPGAQLMDAVGGGALLPVQGSVPLSGPGFSQGNLPGIPLHPQLCQTALCVYHGSCAVPSLPSLTLVVVGCCHQQDRQI